MNKAIITVSILVFVSLVLTFNYITTEKKEFLSLNIVNKNLGFNSPTLSGKISDPLCYYNDEGYTICTLAIRGKATLIDGEGTSMMPAMTSGVTLIAARDDIYSGDFVSAGNIVHQVWGINDTHYILKGLNNEFPDKPIEKSKVESKIVAIIYSKG